VREDGQPPLLEGEDAAAYDQLVARICAAVKPVDIIDEMFIADVASLEWDVLRWRRLKLSLIRARGLEALERLLAEQFEYNLYSEHFAGVLRKSLRTIFRKTRRILRRRWPTGVLRMKRMLSTGSIRFSTAPA
jgi:hypothetical protein